MKKSVLLIVLPLALLARSEARAEAFQPHELIGMLDALVAACPNRKPVDPAAFKLTVVRAALQLSDDDAARWPDFEVAVRQSLDAPPPEGAEAGPPARQRYQDTYDQYTQRLAKAAPAEIRQLCEPVVRPLPAPAEQPAAAAEPAPAPAQ